MPERGATVAIPVYEAEAAFDGTIPSLSAGPFKATQIGLVIEGDPSFAEWELYLRALTTVHQAMLWIVGDLLIYGEKRWPDRYAQALDLFPYEYQTLRNAAWVARSVPMSHRRDAVPWSWYQELAPLEAAAQEELLDRAEEQEWTRNDLRIAVGIEQGKVPDRFAVLLTKAIEVVRDLRTVADTERRIDALGIVLAALEDLKGG